MSRIALFGAAALLAGAALAQNLEQKKPAAESPAPAPRLNLKLDNPGSYARDATDTQEQPGAQRMGGGLPGLGADARAMPKTPPPAAPTQSGGPFPRDSEQTR